jgi:hypothetical protein
MPDSGWRRFSDAFWIAKANFVLNEIETALTGPALNTEVAVPLIAGVTMYPIPAILRKVQRIRFPSLSYLGRVDEDPATRTRYQILGTQFRLRDVPSLSSTADYPVAQAYLNTVEVYQFDRILSPGWGSTAESHVGRAVICYHGTPYLEATEHETLIASGLATDDSQAQQYLQLNGRLRKPLKYGETAVVTSNFVMLEGSRRLTPFVLLSDPSPVPQEWDRVLAKGLRFYLEVQQDEGGANAGTAGEWYALFKDDLDAIQADYNNLDGDNYPIQPRSPAMFNSFRRGIHQ